MEFPSLQLIRKFGLKLNADEGVPGHGQWSASSRRHRDWWKPRSRTGLAITAAGQGLRGGYSEATSAPQGTGAARPARSRGFAARRSPASLGETRRSEVSATPPERAGLWEHSREGFGPARGVGQALPATLAGRR